MKTTAKSIAIGILKALSVLVGVFFLVWFFIEVRELILFIGLALVLSLIGRPLMLFFKNRLKFGNTFSATLTLLLIMGIISLLLYTFVPIIVEQGKNISEINFNQVKRDLEELNMQASDYLGVDHFTMVEAVKQTEFVKNMNVEI